MGDYVTIIAHGMVAGGIPRANVELLEHFIETLDNHTRGCLLNLDELSQSSHAKNAMLDFITLGEDFDVTDEEVMLLFRLLYRGAGKP